MLSSNLRFVVQRLVRNRLWFGALAALLVLAALPMLQRLEFDNDIVRSVASNSARFLDYEAFEKELAVQTRELVVLVSAEASFAVPAYENLRDVALELGLIDKVAFVASPFTMTFAKDHPRFAGQSVLPEDLESVDLEARLSAYHAAAVPARALLSRDRRHAQIIVAAKVDRSDHAAIATLIARLRATTGELALDGLGYSVTGEDVVANEIVAAIKADQNLLVGAGIVICFVAGIVIFGSLRTAVIAFLPPLAGTLMAVVVFAAFAIPVSIISNVIPVIVLVLGLANSIHLVMHLRRQCPSRSLEARIVTTLRQIGPASLLTALTTAIAFGSIYFAGNALLREFALVGAAGMIMSFATVMIAFPMIAGSLALPTSSMEISASRSRLLGVPRRLVPCVLRHARPISVCGFAAFLIGCASYYLAEPSFAIDENLPVASPLRDTNRTIEHQFGGFYQIWVAFDLGGQES